MSIKNTIVLIYGLPCSGKSTLGQSLATRLCSTLISTELLWALIFNRNKSKDDLDMSPEELNIVYSATNRLTDLLLEKNKLLVLEGVFRTNESRKIIENIADTHDTEIKKIFLTSNEKVAKQRLSERKMTGSIAPAGPKTYSKIQKEYEYPDTNEVIIDTSELTDLETLSKALLLLDIR